MVDWSFARRTHSRVMTPVCLAKKEATNAKTFLKKKVISSLSSSVLPHKSV
jgi:hypothetical protein